jgi:hypothetical protein
MNMLFCAASPGLYSFFTEAYPSTFFLFPNEVDAVPDFSTCNSDNKQETLKATNARDHKTRADIVTMNAALSDVFLTNLPKAIRETYKPIRMKQLNTVFLHMFDWFIAKYGKTTTGDCEENWQRMAADWHPSDGFEPLAMRLFMGASYASAACYPMDDRDVIDIGLRGIKRCEMNTKIGSRARTKPRRSPRQSTPSKNIGPTQSHLSTRQLPQPHNMGRAWPPWTTMRQSHRTASHSQTSMPRTPPRKNQ